MNYCNECKEPLTNSNWATYTKNRGLNKCRACEKERIKLLHREQRKSPTFREKEQKQKCISRLKLKIETMLYYGNECIKCGEKNILFLTLDHINNNGKYDKRGVDLFGQLRKLGFPGKNTQLQILCHNCNAIKELIKVRKENQERKEMPEIYIKQSYSISKELDEKLWNEAKELYNKIQIAKSKKKPIS